MNNTLDQLKNTFLNHVRQLLDYDMTDVERAIDNDYLTEHETDDGRPFLHYYDPDEIELVVTPDGEVLDTDDEKIRDYTKFVY